MDVTIVMAWSVVDATSAMASSVVDAPSASHGLVRR